MSHREAVRLVPKQEEFNHIQFAVLLGESSMKLHVGCVMDVGHNWIDVSLPLGFPLPGLMRLAFHPDPLAYDVEEVGRKNGCVRLEFKGPAADAVHLRTIRQRQQTSTWRR